MFELVLSASIPVVTTIILTFYARRTLRREKAELKRFYLNEKQAVITPIENSMSAITTIMDKFTSGQISHAMSILGSKSGAARANKASLEKFNVLLKAQSPLMNMLSERFDINPDDVMQWLSDPFIGPQAKSLIEQYGGQFLGAGRNPGKNNSDSQTPLMT